MVRQKYLFATNLTNIQVRFQYLAHAVTLLHMAHFKTTEKKMEANDEEYYIYW